MRFWDAHSPAEHSEHSRSANWKRLTAIDWACCNLAYAMRTLQYETQWRIGGILNTHSETAMLSERAIEELLKIKTHARHRTGKDLVSSGL